MLRVVFLGKLADVAGCADCELPALETLGWTEFSSRLREQIGPEIAEAIAQDTVKLAVNGSLLSEKKALEAKDGDEIALLPPVSGG